jgi:hypothetical protein
MDDRSAALAFVGRDAAPLTLFKWWTDGELDLASLRSVLPGVWSGVEFPRQVLHQAQWLELFAAAGLLGDEQPREALTVYRGALPGYARGMAWTTGQKRARWFADRWAKATGRKAFVYTVDAPPHAVLATVSDGKESEVVVDPRRIPKPTRVG